MFRLILGDHAQAILEGKFWIFSRLKIDVKDVEKMLQKILGNLNNFSKNEFLPPAVLGRKFVLAVQEPFLSKVRVIGRIAYVRIILTLPMYKIMRRQKATSGFCYDTELFFGVCLISLVLLLLIFPLLKFEKKES